MGTLWGGGDKVQASFALQSGCSTEHIISTDVFNVHAYNGAGPFLGIELRRFTKRQHMSRCTFAIITLGVIARAIVEGDGCAMLYPKERP
jgi:hypothetical protein